MKRFLPIIDSYDNSVKLKRFSTYYPTKVEKRGKIISFSRSSCFRLRKWLQTKSVENVDRVFGITLTCPFSFDSSTACADYRMAFDRWSKSFSRSFPFSGLVFRHELQRRGVPHTHLICFHSGYDPMITNSWVFSKWALSVAEYVTADLEDFFHHGIDFQVVDENLLSLFRYLADHQSKHKQYQLGYKGKQWGVIGRSNFKDKSSVPLNFTERQFYQFLRHLRRLSRFRAKASCVFGSRLVGRSAKCQPSIIFCADITQKRVFDYVRKNF